MADYRGSYESDFTAGTEFHRGGNAPLDFSVPARIRFQFHTSSTDELKDAAEQKFSKLEKQWRKDTQFVSALSDKYLHESYAAIIGMGPIAVPMILRSLKKNPTDWFYALRAITGANPVDPSDAGDISKMAHAWLQWGSQRGTI